MTASRAIRWTAIRKREVVASVLSGAQTTAQVLENNPDLSEEELGVWIAAYKRGNGDHRHLRQKAILNARRAPAGEPQPA